MARPKGKTGLPGGPPADILGDIWDGETWEFTPHEDFDVPHVFINEFVEDIVQVRSGDPYETPSLNYTAKTGAVPSLNDRIEQGWSALAIRLRTMAELLGVSADVAQRNVRNSKGDLLRVDYVFKVKEQS